MVYSIGKYKVVPQKPFPTMEKAVEYIQENYPELDKVTIENYLTPKISDYGKDQSGNLSEENSTSDKDNTEAGSKVVTGVKSNADKSRQPSKG